MKIKKKFYPLPLFQLITNRTDDEVKEFLAANKNQLVFKFDGRWYVEAEYLETHFKNKIKPYKDKVEEKEVEVEDDDFTLWVKESGIKFFYRKQDDPTLYCYVERDDIVGGFSVREKGNFLDFGIPYKPKYINDLLTNLPTKKYITGGTLQKGRIYIKNDEYINLKTLKIENDPNVFIDDPITEPIELDPRKYNHRLLSQKIEDLYGESGLYVLSSIASYYLDMLNDKLGFNPPIFLTGGTGTGKTTLAKIVLSIFSPTHSIQSWDSSYAFVRNYLTGEGVRVLDEYKPNAFGDDIINKLLDAITQVSTLSHSYKTFNIHSKVIFTTNYSNLPRKDIMKMLIIFLPKITKRKNTYDKDYFLYGIHFLSFIKKNTDLLNKQAHFKEEVKLPAELDIRMLEHLKKMAVFMLIFKGEKITAENLNYELKTLTTNLFKNIERDVDQNDILVTLMDAIRTVLLEDRISNKDKFLPYVITPDTTGDRIRYIFPKGSIVNLKHIVKEKFNMSMLLNNQIPNVKAGRIEGRYYIEFITNPAAYPPEYQNIVEEYLDRADEINQITYHKRYQEKI